MGRVWTASQEAAMSIHGKSLLVSAAAGSGKTSVLTERIIRSLTDRENPADISRLLVVTFTRAAAAELKGRIAAALSDALAQDPGNKHLSRQLLLLGSAQISTIDSFFQKVVRSNFEQLDLPATFRIADESEILPLAMETLDGLLEDFYARYAPASNTDGAFSRIEDNPFAQAMDHLLSNRSDGKLNSMLLEFLDVFSSAPEGIEVLNQCATELRISAEREFLETRYGASLSAYLTELFQGYLSELKHLETALEYDPDIALKCSGILTTDISYCRAMLKALDEKNYKKLQATAFSFIAGRFPTIRNKDTVVAAYQSFRAAFRKDISSKVQEKLAWPAELIADQLQHTASLCEMLYRFYSEYEQRLTAEKKQRGILEYNDIRAMLYRLLSSSDGKASDFARSLAAQYDAVYIDEYQDVDLLQDKIFSLIGENRRFMVGDIKQSIYGFRGSDPSIFASYRRAMPLHTEPQAQDADGICVFMSENFRCDRPVIDFANYVCSFLFSACEKSVGYRPQDDLVYSKRASKNTANAEPSPVQVAIFDAPSKKISEDKEENEEHDSPEAIWVAAEISRLLREGRLDDGSSIKPSDIAILVRAKSHGKAFAKELEALNIPVTADLSNDFLRSPLMTDLLNLFRCIDNPYRDLPLSEFLLSPLGGFTLEELTVIRESAPHQKALFDAMTENSKSDAALAKKSEQMLLWLQKMRETAAILPADRFLRLLYLEPLLVEQSNDPVLLFLYEQARTYQRSSWCGLYGFLKHIDKLLEGKPIAADGFCKAESAVTIMTVHHSKGLEFPVVFLCACGASFNRSDTKDTLLFHRNVGCASKLYNRETGETENTILREIIKQEIDAEQTEESIRTLYVALTRARERLYVTGTLRGKWESTVSAAATVRRGNRSAILSASSYLTWILSAWQESELQNIEFPCIFQHILPENIKKGISMEAICNTPQVEKTEQQVYDPLIYKFAEICRTHKDFVYPLSCLQGLPTKAAASKLRPDLLDVLKDEADQNEALNTQIELMCAAVPSFEVFLADRKKPSATDIGTATHAFLEFCNFDVLMKNGIQAECERLVSYGFLSAETARIIHLEQLELFLKSDLMQWILQAKKIYREQKFSLFIPFAKLTRDAALAESLQQHKLFVQGSIDMLLQMPDGSLYLVDYKTDRVFAEEKENIELLRLRMKNAHETQLSCYAEAVREMFGRYPDKQFIYSLPLGSAIEIS